MTAQSRHLGIPKIGIFSLRYTKWGILCEMSQVRHHSDWDFNVIQYIGLFSPKNKLGKVKKLYSQNFSKYDPLKSEGGTSRLAITFLLIIENIHMHSDFSLEKDALSCGNGHFQFQMNRKKFNLKNPRTPPWTFFFWNLIFFLDSLTPFSDY